MEQEHIGKLLHTIAKSQRPKITQREIAEKLTELSQKEENIPTNDRLRKRYNQSAVSQLLKHEGYLTIKEARAIAQIVNAKMRITVRQIGSSKQKQ